jgi:hypothetical protein
VRSQAKRLQVSFFPFKKVCLQCPQLEELEVQYFEGLRHFY